MSLERFYVVGFTKPSMRVGDVATILATVQRPFRPSRLVVPSVMSDLFVIDSLRIDDVEQHVFTRGGVPASVFSEESALSLSRRPYDVGRRTIALTVRRVADRMPWLVRAIRRWLRIDGPKPKGFHAAMLGVVDQQDDSTAAILDDLD